MTRYGKIVEKSNTEADHLSNLSFNLQKTTEFRAWSSSAQACSRLYEKLFSYLNIGDEHAALPVLVLGEVEQPPPLCHQTCLQGVRLALHKKNIKYFEQKNLQKYSLWFSINQ